jgi:hypothetical protein
MLHCVIYLIGFALCVVLSFVLCHASLCSCCDMLWCVFGIALLNFPRVLLFPSLYFVYMAFNTFCLAFVFACVFTCDVVMSVMLSCAVAVIYCGLFLVLLC